MAEERKEFHKFTALNSEEIESWLQERFENAVHKIHSDDPNSIIIGIIEFEFLHELRIKCGINRPHGILSTNDYILIQTLTAKKRNLFKVNVDSSVMDAVRQTHTKK